MLNEMRSQNTDVVLEVGNESFPVHKAVLGAWSPVFKAMFTGGMKESGMTRVPLQGMCPSTMEGLVKFMYTGGADHITEENVLQLLPAASMFQIPKLVEACCVFLERQLDPSNAIGIANFAELHGCAELKQKANHFIERHFTELCNGDEFLELSASELDCLIRKDGLNVREEREVYNAVLSWVTHDEKWRTAHMERLLHAVRCHHLPPSFLQQQVDTCAGLARPRACRHYLEGILQDLKLHKKPVVKERRPNAPRIIYVAGGHYWSQDLDVFEAFHVDDNSWTTLPKLPESRTRLGAACLKGLFYAVGGENWSPGAEHASARVDVYDPASGEWRPRRPMPTPRHWFGVAVMDGLLYAVGGYTDGLECHRSVERYDPETDTWTSVAGMGSARRGAGVAVVDRLLYAFGGFDGGGGGGGARWRWMSSVECYHPERDSWTEVAPMKVKRSDAGVAALGQYIYVAGGYGGARPLASVERYDTERGAWDSAPPAPMAEARFAFSLTAVDGKLYAAGGFGGSGGGNTPHLDTVEVYDPATDAWRSGAPLASARSAHAAAMCYQHVALHCDTRETPPLTIRRPSERHRRSPSAGLASDAAAHRPPA